MLPRFVLTPAIQYLEEQFEIERVDVDEKHQEWLRLRARFDIRDTQPVGWEHAAMSAHFNPYRLEEETDHAFQRRAS